VILLDVEYIRKLSQGGENIIVITETVLLELEDKKKLMEEIGYQARAFARYIAKFNVESVKHKRGFRIAKLIKGDVKVHLITKDKYDTDIEYKYLAESNDKRIIEVCELAQKYYRGAQTIFVSLDVYARTNALFKGVRTETLNDIKDESPGFNFFKTVEVSANELSHLEGRDINEVDTEWEDGNFSYEFLAENGNKEYGVVEHNKTISLIKDGDFKGVRVPPVNLKQKILTKAIVGNNYDLIVVDAKAGSGKTLMAISGAMRLIDTGKYDKIVYVRNSIESIDKGAEIGFLSGNDEKFRIYNMALYDTLEFIARPKHKKKVSADQIEEEVEKLQERYMIETLWPGEARGRTLSRAVVVLDEWQNSSPNTSQLILSRLDNSCKAIIIGSNNQIDNMYLSRHSSGLTFVQKQTKVKNNHLSLFGCELDKAVRGRFAEWAEEVFEKGKWA
jgi:PhoH-like ATPase